MSKETSSDPSTPAIIGEHTTTGDAIWGQSDNGRAVVAISVTGTGVWAESVSNRAIVGINKGEGTGVWSHTDKGRSLVSVVEKEGVAVWGATPKGTAIVAESKDGAGLIGDCVSGDGVVGRGRRGVVGESDTYQGVYGRSRDNAGIVGESQKFHAGFFVSHDPNNAGVFAYNDGGGWGAIFLSENGVGINAKGGRLAGRFEGDVEVTGDVRLTNADCAEDFDIAHGIEIEAGTVMVIQDDGRLTPCDAAYDRRVAGVISGAGQYRPAIVLDKQDSTENRKPIALVGKVYCKVDADYSPVEVGDLLTTSPTQGHAMKAIDLQQTPGSVIGKALGALRDGKGLVPILIALQ